MVKVSVIMPVYNVERYLGEALERGTASFVRCGCIYGVHRHIVKMRNRKQSVTH